MLRTTLNTLSRKALKTLILIFAILIPMASASAGGALPAKHSLGTQPRRASFYVDAGLGIDIFSAPITSQTNALVNSNNVFDTLDHRTRMINSSTVASLGVGYLFPVNRWFNLGGRVFVNYANNFGYANGQYEFNPQGGFRGGIASSTSVRLRNFEYGIDVTPSVNVGANQFLSAIFGIAFNKARLSTTTVSALFAIFPPAGTVQSSMSRSVTGLRLGYSVEELLNRYFAVTMSYIWTGYGAIHLKQLETFRLHENNTGVDFQTHHIMLGLKYYFSPQNYVSHLRAMANAFNRFYAHLAFGALIPQFQMSGESQDFQGGSVFKQQGNQDGQQGAPAPMGVLGLGYGYLIHHFYLGAEALMNVNLANRTSKSELNKNAPQANNTGNILADHQIRIRLNTLEAALDLKLGGLIAPQTLLVGRVGVSVNHILMINSKQIIHRIAPPNFQFIDQRINKTVVGFRFGLGLEKLFSDNVSLVMNYIYTYYGHIAGGAQSTPTVDVAITPYSISNVDARVATHAVTIGVNYYFS